MKLFANVDGNGRCLSFGEYVADPGNGFPLEEIPRTADGFPDDPRRYEVLNGMLLKNEAYSADVDSEILADASGTQSDGYISQLESALTETERLAAEVAEYDAALTEIETALGVSV